MQLLIDLEVDSKLEKQETKELVYSALHNWFYENNGAIPLPENYKSLNNKEGEELIKVGEIIVN